MFPCLLIQVKILWLNGKVRIWPLFTYVISKWSLPYFELPNFPDLLGQVIRNIVATMDFEDDLKYNDCLKEVISKHSRLKKEITSICEDIMELKSVKGTPPCVFVLYSTEDHSYKVLML